MSSTSAINQWNWKASGQLMAAAGKPMSHRTKALIQAPIMVGIGFLSRHYGHRVGSTIIWILAGLVLVGGLFIPPLFKAIENGGKKLGHWIGAAITWGLMVPFFFLCFVPGRWILALSGKDPLTRKFPSDEPTYWIPRPPVPSLDQYKKQH